MTINVCDICQERPVESVAILAGYIEDPCDGRTRQYEQVDLCLKHLKQLVDRLLKEQCAADYAAILASDYRKAKRGMAQPSR
jgi:hypothetical protein